MPSLRVTSGPGAGKSHDVDREIVIGREGVDLEIQDLEVSRRHAAVRPAGNGIEIEDLGSRNGTFVNGERIEGNRTLTETATLRVGTTEITVEIPVATPDVTAPRTIPDEPVAGPEVTAPRKVPDQPVAGPDVTARRRVPDQPVAEPDVTAPRKVPDQPVAGPDVTAPRKVPDQPPAGDKPVAEPDVTAPREIAEPPAGDKPVAEPDVTALRKTPDQPVAGPDVTAPRKVPDERVAGPDVTAPRKTPDQPVAGPDVTAPRRAAGAPLADPDVTAPRRTPEPTPAPPAQPPPGEPAPAPERPGGGIPAGKVAAFIAVGVLAVVLILVLFGGGGSASHSLDYTLNIAAIERDDPRRPSVTFAGVANGGPFGPGNATLEVFRRIGGKPRPGTTTSLRIEATLRTGSGTAKVTVRARSRFQADNSLRFSGSGNLTGGTGDYEGAAGRFKVSGRRANFKIAVETIRFQGSAEY